MKTKKEKYLVLSVELKGKGVDLKDSVDEIIKEIVEQIKNVSIAEIFDEGKETSKLSLATKEDCEEAIGKLTGATAIICPTPLDRIAFLHAIGRWKLELEAKWASGARIVRRFHHYKDKLTPEQLEGYDIRRIHGRSKGLKCDQLRTTIRHCHRARAQHLRLDCRRPSTDGRPSVA